MRQRPARASKITPEGVYLPFKNITTVWYLELDDSLRALPGLLEQAAGRWISPLPASSYHATLMAGPTAATGRGDDDFLRTVARQKRQWGAVAEVLAARRFAPATMLSGGLKSGRRGASVRMACRAEESSAIADLRAELRGIASGCGFETRERPLHVTLAYERSAAGPMPDEALHAVTAALQTVPCLSGRQPLRLRPAVLCYSPSMTAFAPWDGTPAQLMALVDAYADGPQPAEADADDAPTAALGAPPSPGGRRRKRRQQ
eukprot:TRINITY_DN13576_c0_g1_i1.p2 TRINITY_DN13576_c0_g1~~TRINITY_DN13576_c0_g1_i1.p2  ORF type:complete len:261 (+),score=29.77 TRINITY_DN13576_c0_g1_i1:83-865(+)